VNFVGEGNQAKVFCPLFLLVREAQKNGQSSSRCGSVTLAFCRRTVAAFITLTPLRYACPYRS